MIPLLKRIRVVAESAGMAREQRRHPRIKRRVHCQVMVSGRTHAGVVLNLSHGGFFVQTGARARIGSTVAVRIHARAGDEIELEARVANAKRVRPELMSVARGGLGCALAAPNGDYVRFLVGLMA